MGNKMLVDSRTLELLSGCNNNFMFIGDLKSGELQWSDNSMLQFSLKDNVTEDPEIWKRLIWQEDLAAFETGMAEMLQGEHEQMQGEYMVNICGGKIVPVQFHIWPVTFEEDKTYYVGVISNIVSQKTFDIVTGLKSGYDFRSTIAGLIRERKGFGLLTIGVDSLKRINDMHSYTFGDEVMKKFAKELELRIPEGAQLYRLEGEGIGMLYEGADKSDLAFRFAKFQEILQAPFIVEDIPITFNFHGAGCVFPEDGDSTDELLKNMRIVLNIAKNGSNGAYVAYTKAIAAQAKREQQLMEYLKESVNHNFFGFSLKYQPLIFSESGKLYGCEVLLRWAHREFPEEVTPTEFIPMLENMGLILRVGKWVLQKALKQLSRWVVMMPDFQMSINAACAQFEDPEFRFFVMDCLTKEKLNPNLLTLELTESDQIRDTEAISHAFDFFRSQGIKIAFDDFGMGYASFDIFRVLSADELKIDKSFLERLTYDVTDQKIIAHLISLCDSMNMSVCVEGVETPEVLNIIRQLGPKFLQGYYYNKPMTAREFEEYYLIEKVEDISEIVPSTKSEPEKERTMVYAEYRPVQPMSMNELVNTVHAGIFQVGMDHEFTFLTCNEGYRKMLGYTSKEIEEKFKNQALGFVHPDDMEFVNQEIRRQLGMGDLVTIEFRVVRADGSPIWILGTGNVVKGKEGNVSLSVVIVNNNEFKKRNLEIESRCKKYKKILDNIPTGVKCVRFDEDFTLDYISPAFLSLMGYNESEIHTIFRDSYLNMICEEDREQLFNDIFEQLRESNIVTLHYRTPCKDGRKIWVETVSRLCPPEEDGIQRCYSSVVNITDSIADEAKQRTKSLANRYKDAAARWGDVLFEVDAAKMSVDFSEEYQTMFGRYPEDTVDMELKYVHPDDRKLITDVLQRTIDGKRCAPIEIRILKNDEYHWYSIYVNEPDILGNTSMAVIGKICDIDSEKKERDKLLARSQQDALTGLLNKSTMEEKIRLLLSTLQPWDEYVIYMIDVDDFKVVNDRMGHPFGDEVLRSVAKKLQNLFHKSALVGRAGGDEFMVFLKLEEGQNVAEKGREIVDALKGTYTLGDSAMIIEISVGGAHCPKDGEQFYDLFRRADSALYRAKAKGKDQSCMFSGEV